MPGDAKKKTSQSKKTIDVSMSDDENPSETSETEEEENEDDPDYQVSLDKYFKAPNIYKFSQNVV